MTYLPRTVNVYLNKKYQFNLTLDLRLPLSYLREQIGVDNETLFKKGDSLVPLDQEEIMKTSEILFSPYEIYLETLNLERLCKIELIPSHLSKNPEECDDERTITDDSFNDSLPEDEFHFDKEPQEPGGSLNHGTVEISALTSNEINNIEKSPASKIQSNVHRKVFVIQKKDSSSSSNLINTSTCGTDDNTLLTSEFIADWYNSNRIFKVSYEPSRNRFHATGPFQDSENKRRRARIFLNIENVLNRAHVNQLPQIISLVRTYFKTSYKASKTMYLIYCEDEFVISPRRTLG
jgi:hypothetical protein